MNEIDEALQSRALVTMAAAATALDVQIDRLKRRDLDRATWREMSGGLHTMAQVLNARAEDLEAVRFDIVRRYTERPLITEET